MNFTGSKSKAETFIGFAIKAGKFRSGANTVSTVKRAFVVLVCESAAENTVKTALKYAEKFRCKALKTDGVTLSELARKDGIKIAVVTDKSLADAIILNAAPRLKPIN